MLLGLSACTGGATHVAATPAHYVDVRFPVARVVNGDSYPHTVDETGRLWYIDGGRIVYQPRPGTVRAVRDESVRSGTIFRYGNAIYVLTGDGRRFIRIDPHFHRSEMSVPPRYAPIVGVVADTTRQSIVAAQLSPHEVAVAQRWRWHKELFPRHVDPFVAVLAGSARGAGYLIVSDPRNASIAIKNLRDGGVASVSLPSNVCFNGTSALRIPVDARSRDAAHIWVTSGQHVASVDVRTRRVLHVWNLDGCAMHVLAATPGAVTIAVANTSQDGYAFSVAKVDVHGAHPLDKYGTIAGLGAGTMLDRLGSLWWFDPHTNSFVRRTPLS